MKKLLVAVAVLAVVAIANADVIWSESFETDGLGTRYFTDQEITDGASDYFGRFQESDVDGGYSDFGGSYWYGGQDQDGDGEPELRTNLFLGINISGYTDLIFSGLFGEVHPESAATNDIDRLDYIHLSYRIDAGSWQNLMWWENDDQQYNSIFLRDTDFDGTGDDASQELWGSMSNYTATISGIGTTLDILLEASVDSGDEDWAMDNLQVEGNVIPEPTTAALFGLAIGLLAMIRKRW